MQRYFGDIVNNKIVLSKDDEHHICHVMRNKIDDEIEVVNSKKVYLCKISGFNPLKIDIEKDLEIKNNTVDVSLFFALAKGDKNDLVIQKATELGVKNIILIETKRCVSKFDKEDFTRKLVRYEKIVKEACEQSKRIELPKILGVYKINEIPKELLTNKMFIAYEKEIGSTSSFFDEVSNLKNNDSVSIAIGPEGGFEESEVNYLNTLGFKNVSLGNRILRTETAAIYAMSVLGFMLER